MDLAASLYNKLSEALGNPHVVNEVPSSYYEKLTPTENNGNLWLYEHQYIDCTLQHPLQQSMLVRLFRMPKGQKVQARSAFHSLSVHMTNFNSNFTKWYTANKLTYVSELIRQNPEWSSAHIAVQAGLTEVMTPEKMSPLINSQNCEKRRSPMHLACDLHKLDMLERCAMIGGDLALQDQNGDTVIHYAVSKCSLKFVKFVCGAASGGVLDIQNNVGETALHIACRDNKPEYCRILLQNGARTDKCSLVGYPLHLALKRGNIKITEMLLEKCSGQVNYLCNKHKGLPVHWCKTREDVELLVKHGSKVIGKSSTGDMPLHVMMLKNRLDAAIGLIFSHADINVKGKYGNTPLHLAIINDNARLVKLLLLFGADCQAQNDLQESPGLLAMRNWKPNKDVIIELLSSVGGLHFEIPEKVNVAAPVNHFPSTDARKDEAAKAKILCLDGGGIRGLVLTQFMIAIEEETGKQIRDLFDWICGTSTGGILALALTLGIKAVDCQSIYFRLKDKVFAGPRPYDSSPMENFLKSVFGEDTTLSELQGDCKVIITSVLADQRPASLYLFRNYEPSHELTTSSLKHTNLSKTMSMSLQDVMNNPMDTPLWQVARSSGAAPTYFQPMGSFVDGGVLSNNPTLDALTEVHRYNKVLKQMNRTEEAKPPRLVVSVGTGKVPQAKVKSLKLVRPTNPINLLNSAQASYEMTQIMIDAMCECDGHVVKRAEAWCESINVSHYRLNPQLKQEIAMNETDDEKLIDMMWTTKLYIHKNKQTIQEIACSLLSP